MAKTLTWLGFGAILAAVSWRLPAEAQSGYAADPPFTGLAGRDLIAHFQESETRPTTLTVVDPQARAVAVYHLNRETGKIELKSVRNIRWDLAMSAFNSDSPLPEEIRKGLERQP